MELISRKDVVEVALRLMIEVNLGVMNDTNKHLVKQIANEVLYDVIKCVYDIPTVEEREESEWINDTKYSGWTCKHCNYHDGNATDKYCPNCGAKMIGK